MLASLASLGGRYYNIPPYNDEPKLYHVASMFPGDLDEHGLGRASGSSLLKERAIAKALGETVERLAAMPPSGTTPLVSTYVDLQEPALAPSDIPFNCRGRAPSDSDPVAWLPGNRIVGESLVPTLIPAQLVYLPYSCVEGEPLWFIPTSNGLGAGTTLEQALLSGVLELLERDALMRYWACPEKGFGISQASGESSRDLQELLEITDRYGFSVQFILLPTLGMAAHTVLAALRDDQGDWPEFSFGLKSGFELSAVMLGALEESHQLRPWLREVKEQATEPPHSIRTIDERAIWWVGPDGRTSAALKLSEIQKAQTAPPAALSLSELIQRLSIAGHQVYFVSLESPIEGYHVVRAIIPSVAPVSFNERYPVASTRPGVFAISERHPLL